MTKKVFEVFQSNAAHKSIIRLSCNGTSSHCDQLKIDHLSPTEKLLLREKFSEIVAKLRF